MKRRRFQHDAFSPETAGARRRTNSLEVLLEKPSRPYSDVALLESRGELGVPEADLVNDAREKARVLGADAIVKLESERLYRWPVALYDPWFEPYALGWYRYRPFPRYRDRGDRAS
jgi:hypothetical protein